MFGVLLCILVIYACVAERTDDTSTQRRRPATSPGVRPVEQQPGPAQTDSAGVEVPAYTVWTEEGADSPISTYGKAQVILRVIVSGNITEQGLRALVQKLYDEIKDRKHPSFRYYQRPTHIIVEAYLSQEYSGEQYLAKLQKWGLEDRLTISINDTQLRQLTATPQARFGLSEEKRKLIFREHCAAGNRADVESLRRFPKGKDMFKQFDLAEELFEKYLGELGAKHGLTREQIDAISLEGMEKDWPRPTLKFPKDVLERTL